MTTRPAWLCQGFRIVVWLVALTVWSGIAHAQETPGAHAKPETPEVQGASAALATPLFYRVDPTGHLDLAAVTAAPASQWQSMSPNGSLGYRSDTIWFHAVFALPSHAAAQRWVLVIANPVLDDARVWVQGLGPDGTPGPWQHWAVGDKLPFDQRPIPTQHFALPLAQPPDAQAMRTLRVYVRMSTTSSVQLPLRLLTVQQFERSERLRGLLFGAYAGLMAGLLIYNLVIWAVVRERQYGWHIGWMFSFALFVLSLDGFTFQYLWPDATQWNDRVLVLLLSASVVLGSCFINDFLRTSDDAAPPLALPAPREAIWLLPAVLIATSLPYSLGIRAAIALALALVLRSQIMIAVAIRRGSRQARILLAAFLSVSLGGVVLATQRFGLSDYTLVTQHWTMAGSAIEVILLSLALGERLLHARQLAASAVRLASSNESLADSNAALRNSRQLAEERLAALVRLQERLRLDTEARDRERLRFLASAVHDLKQPLQAIGALLLPLEQAVARHDQAHALQMLGLTRQATQGMSNQLTALLDLSRLESGMEPTRLQPLALAALVDGLTPQFELLARRLGVTVSAAIPPELSVQSDAQLLARVISNLVINGIKYSDASRAPHCQVALRAERTDTGASLTIADNGLGIPPEQLASGAIYRPFFQGHNHLPEDIKGVGLGLSIVTAALRQLPLHHLSLVSEVGEGTVFTLTLPKADAAPLAPARSGSRALAHAQQLAGCYVLVVEDDYLVRESLVHMLNAFQILTDAYPSVGALEADIGNLERTPDAVLCDYRLPGGRTAHDVALLVLDRFEHVPFLMVSAEHLEPTDFTGILTVAVCAKPIDADELIEALAALMARGAARP